uniref:Carboxypeptidase B n=1 Tax=Caligus rogercresseyi TaxID=217165 RepID=C1BQ52_CALRO|nr:Carboxypeptidase B [Caligus rogercresseyi]
MEDVGMMFKNESKKKASLRQGGKYAIDWNDYYGLEDIYTYLDQITVGKESYVSVETYGYSFEGRPLKLIRISRAGANSPNILVEGGIHAREWISPAMTTYMIHSLLLDPKNDHYLDKFNFHIIPSANPDGYEFSRNDTRFWRKTRSININSTCRGVDPNRNWGFHWHESGVSDDPCSEIFPGIEPFSEVEVASLRNYSLSLNPAPVMSLCIHSAAELFLVPYGYAVGALPENFKEMEEVGQKAVDALNGVHESTFEVINAAAFWPGAGAADDWYKGVLKSRFVYTIELRKGAGNIFDLPVDQIIPSGEELMPSIKVLLDNVYYLETHQ